MPATTTITINYPGLVERTIHGLTADSTAELVKWEPSDSANTWYALLIDGQHYNLVMWKHTIGRPERMEALNAALTEVQAAITALQAPAPAPTLTFVKSTDYDRITHDYTARLDGEYIGSYPTHHEAEVALDQLEYELLASGITATAERMVITRSAPIPTAISAPTPTTGLQEDRSYYEVTVTYRSMLLCYRLHNEWDYGIDCRAAMPDCAPRWYGTDIAALDLPTETITALRELWQLLFTPPSPTPAPSEITTCPVCKRQYVTAGRSIHYCVDRRERPVSREYVAHYDNHQVGCGYDTYIDAEIALDDYCCWRREAGLVGALDNGNGADEIAAEYGATPAPAPAPAPAPEPQGPEEQTNYGGWRAPENTAGRGIEPSVSWGS